MSKYELRHAEVPLVKRCAAMTLMLASKTKAFKLNGAAWICGVVRYEIPAPGFRSCTQADGGEVDDNYTATLPDNFRSHSQVNHWKPQATMEGKTAGALLHNINVVPQLPILI